MNTLLTAASNFTVLDPGRKVEGRLVDSEPYIPQTSHNEGSTFLSEGELWTKGGEIQRDALGVEGGPLREYAITSVQGSYDCDFLGDLLPPGMGFHCLCARCIRESERSMLPDCTGF